MSEENNDGQNANASDQTSMADLAAGLPAASVDDSSQAAAAASAAAAAKDDGNKTDMEKFIQTQNQSMETLKNQVTSANEKVTEIVNREQKTILNKAVDDAVANITDGVGDKNRVKLADTFLNTEYRTNPEFAKIFDARNEHPEIYAKALAIVKEEFKAVTQTVIDPLIAENQRALMDSQKQGNPVQEASEAERLNKLSPGALLREMRGLARAG